ncbi:PadR family transcriptional regulator [Gordonia sp. NB41Y]|uniref:PadR family transcriptional regulator n=1 Tax=Gordonia sp. NB41Y TaxID=875808 RepID=UPI0002BF1849|nr:PadR family transcriptional regulator [Gordonia sp. NB41Y]EMP12726.1 PadR family transcriptional regulator [Gordonia sp. NB41Y]WLP90840.1 PadR family transcriptional regulator [Gordonia sp. NB41Y]
MALRHAILAELLDDAGASGYRLAKTFDVAVASYWYATPQQLYAELTRLEAEGLISGREVVQERRPNKRVYTLTPTGREVLEHFVEKTSRPTFMRDDLLVKVRACDIGEVPALIDDLRARSQQALVKAEFIEALLAKLRGDMSEDRFLAENPRIGPYLTGLRGIAYERENAAWCRRVADVLTARGAAG